MYKFSEVFMHCLGKDCLFRSKTLILDSSWTSFKCFMCIKRMMLCITRFSFKKLLFPLLFPKIVCLACSYAAKNNGRTSGFAKKICFWLKCWRWVLSSQKYEWQEVFFCNTWGLSDLIWSGLPEQKFCCAKWCMQEKVHAQWCEFASS